MLLLFEIGRRLGKNSDYNKLPIARAIVRLVKLLEAKKCSFKDVFLKGGKLHCFSDTPAKQEAAIERINDAYRGNKGSDDKDEGEDDDDDADKSEDEDDID